MIYKKRAKMRGIKGKKAVSEIVSYVLLISLALGMSVLVYSWLKYKIGGVVPPESCHEGVSLVLEDHSCIIVGGEEYINITVRNRGRFTVNGFIIKMSNISKGIAGIYPLYRIGTSNNTIIQDIMPFGIDGDRYSKEFYYGNRLRIRQVEIEPIEKGAYCEKAVVSYPVCCPKTDPECE